MFKKIEEYFNKFCELLIFVFCYKKYNFETAKHSSKMYTIESLTDTANRIGKAISGDNLELYAAFRLEVANLIDYDVVVTEQIDEMSGYAERAAYYGFLHRKGKAEEYIELSAKIQEEVMERIFIQAVERCKERGLLPKDVIAHVDQVIVDDDGTVHRVRQNTER